MHTCAIVASLACLAAPALAEEVLIGTGSFGTFYGLGADYSHLPCRISFGTPGGATLFEDRGYTTEDVGTAFSATADSDPDFDAVAAWLADGVSERIQIWMGAYHPETPLGVLNAYPENSFWRQYPRPDLQFAAAGRPITRIEMTVDRADVTWTGSFTNWEPSATWRVYVEEFAPGDFNRDGAVNVQDLLAYLGAFRDGADGADLDENGAVNVQDLLTYLAWFRQG